jgi:hypothetical protein
MKIIVQTYIAVGFNPKVSPPLFASFGNNSDNILIIAVVVYFGVRREGGAGSG